MRALSESLTTATGFNVTGLYDRVQANEEFDRKADVIDGFTRVTDANFDEVVSSCFTGSYVARGFWLIAQLLLATGCV